MGAMETDGGLETQMQKLSLSEMQLERKRHPPRNDTQGCSVIPASCFEAQNEASAGGQVAVSCGIEDYLCAMDDNGGDNDSGSSVWGDDSDSSVCEDHDGSCVGEDETSGSSAGTELALKPAWCEAKWVPRPDPTEEEKAVQALHVVRCLQLTECDPKWDFPTPTRFCQLNIALFDLEKESTAGLGPPLRTLPQLDCISLENSVNLISVKILESDVGYPISVFGTILVRDQVDYKCVSLFRRCKDSPQVITSQKDMLTLTGPQRGLAVTSSMFFEINLKIKVDGGEQDFSKGVIEHCATNSSHTKPIVTRPLTSWMSTLQLVYTDVPCALEATLAVNILKGPQDFFTGEVTAWTKGNQNRVVLYDSGAAGTVTALGDGGSVVLSRCLVAVPVDEELVLAICVRDGGSNAEFELSLGHSDGEHVCKQGSCEVLVTVTWTCMLRSRRHEVFEWVGDTPILV